jgi:predicted nucleic acid-binding protein
MRKERNRYLFDTVVLSNFALAGRFDLVVARYGKQAVITPEVLDEVTDGVVAGYYALSAIEEAVDGGSISRSPALPTATERQAYRELLRALAPGEASCIAHAAAHGAIVVTDDRTARACCKERNIVCTGTIGILKACTMDGTLTGDEADAILHAMVDAGYYAPVQNISDLA